ncbi:hypothetical protein I6N96_19155 [Enterococcus sp. BWM-S5]|uniref:B3/B4 tRNA-binding domain-containing protein n=1 Tax=Enterococcus larvae TaxID=2794352 RepID=A0ABS4CPG4_9ENTE|nr:phenylalanine--tRNA ligase beta subunit-related protein [Enterococcus larvae]MBP1048403.1 hypothetical protein [Enterococcus larvae]
MKKVIINEEFWELFPEAQINFLVMKDIDNHIEEKDEAHFTELLKDAAKEADKFLTEESFSSNPVVAQWRDAFSKFKTKKGARSSIEALLKRVNQQRKFFPINPLVDIYNSVSLKYGVPSGGEDVDKIEGHLYLGKANGGESFFPLGAENDSPALPEELIYFDEVGAICRCLNWREAQRTMLTEETTNAILVIEAINNEQAKRANLAIHELKNLVDAYFKTNSTIYTLSKETAEAEIG